MKTELLEIKASLQIQKPVPEVFEAIVDPKKMSNYFISESSGRMMAGKEVIWKFPEFEIKFPVRVEKIVKNEYISFRWDIEKRETLVEMQLSSAKGNSTLVTITEKSMENDEEGLRWLSGNTMGWANFLACLKAYMEYGINLRNGAFDFMKGRF